MMNIIHNRQIVALYEYNLQFLTEQTHAARSRFYVGEGIAPTSRRLNYRARYR